MTTIDDSEQVADTQSGGVARRPFDFARAEAAVRVAAGDRGRSDREVAPHPGSCRQGL